MDNPRQGYGEIKIKFVAISQLNFTNSFVLKKLIDSSSDVFETVNSLRFRVSFYDQALDRISAPIVFSH